MNTEQQFAEQIRLALDESAAQLPYRVSYRLQAARQAALGRLKAPEMVTETAPAFGLAAAAGGAGVLTLGGAPHADAPRWGWLLLTVVTVLVLVAGFIAINEWSDQDFAQEIADIDLAILLDDVPISAYADRGFGVYIKNTDE